jgi:Tfp pilus assembly protein PilP
MALTMRRAKLLTISFALAMLAACGVSQAQQPAQTTAKPSTQTKPAAQAPAKTPAQTNSQATTQAKPKTPPAAPQAAAQKKPEGAAPPPAKPASRRDPFVTLVGKQNGGGSDMAVKLPPGKAGLQVSTVILQGIVSGPNGMIAVVANPQRSVYFLHEGDALFDGRVEKIKMGEVTFHEVGKDAFGKPLEREVTKKLNPSSGEQP